MSNEAYKNKWQDAINDLQEQLQLEGMQLENEAANQKRSTYEQFQFYGQLYIKYIDIYKKLEDCYDQTVHPQKSRLLKQMLENTMVRMCETKRALVLTNTHSNSYQCDFVNLDELIMDLKLTPESLEVPVPRYFRRDDPDKVLTERNQIIDKMLVEFHDTNAPEEEVIEDRDLLEIGLVAQINIIQKMERGRQGIDRTMIFKYAKKQDQKKQEKNRKLAEGIEIPEEQEREDGIIVIQKYWRGYKGREAVHFLREEELLFLGMKKQLEDPRNPNSQLNKALMQREKMIQIQNEHKKEYNQALGKLKYLVSVNEGPEIKERKRKERIEWIETYLDRTNNKKLPEKATDFYDKEKMYPLTAEEQEALGKTGKKDEKKPQAAKPGKGKGGKGSTEPETKKEPPLSVETAMKLTKEIEEFSTTWGSIDESQNFEQKYVTEVAMQEQRPLVETEIDEEVDKLIETELTNKSLFLFGKPRKMPKGKGKGKGKGKDGKKGKDGARKMPKVPGMGLVKGRTPLDQLSELVEAGIVKKLMPASLTDLKGDQNVLGSVQERQYEIMPDPSFAQLRQILSEYIAIPLGSTYAKQNLQEKLNFFLFYGPPGSGKTLAVRALQNECNAIVVDLSPSTIENKATDKNSISKTIFMAFNVAKEFQPAIIYVDQIEQIFGAAKKKKGVPAAAWAKLRKPLQDFKKAKFFEPNDRVAFIGCTSRPQDCQMKDTKLFFEKKFFFPYPNYGTRKFLFKFFIEQKGIELPHNFPLNSIAHISEGYTAGSFKSVIDKVVSQARIKRLKDEPLKMSEFYAPLSKAFFIYQADYEKMRQFTDEVTGMKERRDKEKEALNQDPKKPGKGKGK